jgi:hypothetical protein
MNDPKGYYHRLGVDKNASQEEIRSAYRRRSLEVHPDRNRTQDAHVEFIALQEAYEVLKDSRRRAEYDSTCIEVPTGKQQEQGGRNRQDTDFSPIRCSVCNCVTAQPRYVVFWEVVSFLGTTRSPVQGVMCTKCAGKKAYEATRKSLALGWWGIWGLLLTPLAVAKNISGGEMPAETNGRLLLHQSWYFARQGRLDLAYFLASDARRFLGKSYGKEKDSLLSVCNAIISQCQEYAAGRTLEKVWEKNLPRTGDQWKAVGICTVAWFAVMTVVSSYTEQQTQKAKEGAPEYSYQRDQSTQPSEVERHNAPTDEAVATTPTTYLPVDTGYLPDKDIGSTGGYSTITLNNDSDSDFHIRLYALEAGAWVLSREVYLKAQEEFVMEDVAPGEYEIRRMDVQTKAASKSKSFALTETTTSEGVKYNAVTITFDAVRGNSRVTPINAREF